MADRGDTHYHVPSLNLWFLFSAVFFLLTIVWTVIDDWNAEWKQYQRNFRQLDLAKTQAELEAMEVESESTEAELRLAVANAESALEDKRMEVQAADETAYAAKETRFAVEENFKKAKSVLNWEIFLAEKELLDPEGKFSTNEEMESSLEGYRKDVVDLEKDFQDADLVYLDKKAAAEALKSELFNAEANLAVATRDLDRLRSKIQLLDPSDIATQAANVVRDFPGLDFIGPNLQVQKYVLDDLTFDLNFTKKTRIDMCTTCHMGMEMSAFSQEELEPYLADLELEHAQPYTAHPRLDLFLTSKSPHPAKDFGCTICHRGSGESLSFQHVDHRPSDSDEKNRWKYEHDWHKQKYWDYPMLRSKNVEASCVQCHKESMELIADDAPTATMGYRLFEEKGCYACHKVDWFPVDRKPGPPLKNLAAKLNPGFVDAWIAKPRDFRPETDMPQVFHLENYKADEIVTHAMYDTDRSRPIMGEEWNQNAVAAVTAYLYDNHPVEELPEIPSELEANPERGREIINVKGCFACHNTEPWDESTFDGVPALSNHVTEHNEMGPNLRGVATKVNVTWLYHWLLDPKSYWAETRMPSMGLTEQDALDVASYIMEDPDGIFTDVPEGWADTADYTSAFNRDVLAEQARTFYQKLGRGALEEKLEGDWADNRVLAAAVGEAFVKNQGCFSCHEIGGMETMMPIGAELSTWGSKTPDKLDFGLAYLKEVEGRPKLDKYYREGWLERKLHHPRSFDIEKVKMPKDRLRMPWFDFSEEEVTAISTFVLGLVQDEVQDAKMESTPQQLAMDEGMRSVRQNNCMACHVVEPGSVTYKHEDGHDVTITGEIQALFTGDDDPTYPPDHGVYLKLPPTMDSLADFNAEREAAENWLREVNEDDEIAVEEVYVSLLGVNPDAGQGVGAPGEKVAVPLDDLVSVNPSLGGSFVRHITEYYAYGTFVENPDYDPDDEESGSRFWRWSYGYDEDEGLNQVEDVDGVLRAYGPETYDKVRWTFAPPLLVNEGHKVQADWFYSFLEDPQPLRKQIRVKMPQFSYEEGEAEAIANYFAVKAGNDWPARFSRTLRLVMGRNVKGNLAEGEQPENGWALPEQALEWPTAGLLTTGQGLSVEELAASMDPADPNALTAETIHAIEKGAKVDTEASFPKLHAWAESQGFSMVGPTKWGHERVQRRSHTYMQDRSPFLSVGHAVAIEGVNCYQCHPNGDVYPETPIAWAPSLDNTRSRLREDWVHEWLWAPSLIYPGTAMLTNFAADDPQYQDQYPDSSNEEQIQAVMDWLYNMDRPRSQ